MQCLTIIRVTYESVANDAIMTRLSLIELIFLLLEFSAPRDVFNFTSLVLLMEGHATQRDETRRTARFVKLERHLRVGAEREVVVEHEALLRRRRRRCRRAVGRWHIG